MTIQQVIQISLIAILVWEIWFFHIRMGVKWGEKGKRKPAKQRKKAKKLDVLMSGRVDELVRSGEITEAMASSLANDSADALRISQMLVDIAMLLYAPRDNLARAIDEHLVEAEAA